MRLDQFKALLDRMTDNTNTWLNLSNKLIKNKHAKVLAKFLTTHSTLISLNLRFNELSAEGIKALAANNTLTALDLACNQIDDEGAKPLATNNTLTWLDLTSLGQYIGRGNNVISHEGAKAFAANNTLISLNLTGNRIGDEGAKALAANNTLTALRLCANRIGAEGAKALAANNTLTALHLSGNQIGDEGLKALAANSTLTWLNVSCCKQIIGTDGDKAFVSAAADNYAMLNIIGLDKDTTAELLPYWERNRKIQSMLTQKIDNLSTENDAHLLNQLIQQLNDMLLALAQTNSDNANAIKTKLNEKIKSCIDKHYVIFPKNKSPHLAEEALLSVSSHSTHYEKYRFAAFEINYLRNTTPTSTPEEKRQAFLAALEILRQGDKSYKCIFSDQHNQKVFDAFLTAALSKTYSADQPPLNSFDRQEKLGELLNPSVVVHTHSLFKHTLQHDIADDITPRKRAHR